MRSPSARCLINVVDIYVPTDGQDADGGYKPIYASAPTYSAVPCTVQVGEYTQFIEEAEGGTNRIIQELHYKIMSNQANLLGPLGKIIWVDAAGISHTLYVNAQRDEAGRGAAFTVKATERL